MRRFAVFFAGVFFALSFAHADAVRYKDRMFSVKKTSDVVVASGVPFFDGEFASVFAAVAKLGEPLAYFFKDPDLVKGDLLVDLYEPAKDDENSRPLVIVAHGGFFVAGHKGDSTQKTVAYCDSLAARGYVAASLEYRLGTRMTDFPNNTDADGDKVIDSLGDNVLVSHVDSADFAQTVYRTVQDLNATVRYFRANAKKYGIDPGKVYLMGNSAGAIMALENIYAEEKDFPEWMDVAGLGDIDEFGEDGDGVADGVVALWGAVHDKSMIKGKKTPVFLAYGGRDETVPFGTARALENGDAAIKRNAGKYAAFLKTIYFDIDAPTLYGSAVIDSVLTAEGVAHTLHYEPEGLHEFYDDTLYKDGVAVRVYEESLRPAIFDFFYSLTTGVYGTEKGRKDSIRGTLVALEAVSAPRMGEGNRSFTVARGKDVRYAVYDLRGRRQMLGTVSVGESVDLSVLNSGVYVLRVKGERAVRFGIEK